MEKNSRVLKDLVSPKIKGLQN